VRLQEFGPAGEKGSHVKCQNVRHLSKFRSNPLQVILRATRIASHSQLLVSFCELWFTTNGSKRHREVEVRAKEFCLIWPLPQVGENYLEVVVSLPQHSGRAGNSALFQPPPRAWTSVTASTMRRPRRFTAVTSSERAAV
jgi:hypothetical protein